MAPNRTSSPTSLLWAHQLKREHGFLLDRMRKLDTEIGKVAVTAEATKAASSGNDIAAIAEKVKRLSDKQGSTEAGKLTGEVTKRLEDVSAQVEALVLKVASMEKTTAKLEQDRKNAFHAEKTMLKRVKDVEENLRKHKVKLEEVESRVEEDTIDQIRTQLDRLTEQVRKDGASAETTKASLRALEEVTAALRKGSEKLVEEMQDMASRRVRTPVETIQPALAEAPIPASAIQELPQSMNVRSDVQRVDKKNVSNRKGRRAPKTVRGPAKAPESERSMIKLAALASQSAPSMSGRKANKDEQPNKSTIQPSPERVMVARTPSLKDDTTVVPAEKPPLRRGQPRKAKASQMVEGSKRASGKSSRGQPRKNTTKPLEMRPKTMRRTIKQTDDTPAVSLSPPRSLNRTAAASPEDKFQTPTSPARPIRTVVLKQPAAARERRVEENETTLGPAASPVKMNTRRGLTHLFSSPISSPPPSGPGGLEDVEARRPAEKKRRTIQQDDDDGEDMELLRKYSSRML